MNAPALLDDGTPRGRQRRLDFGQRLEAMKLIVGFGPDDQKRILATREVLATHSDEIAAAFYQQLLSHPETAQHFVRVDGRTDRGHVDARAETLQVWLQAAVEAPLDGRMATYLAQVGRAHTGRGGVTSTAIKGRYLIAAGSVLFACIAAVLASEVDDAAALAATLVSWQKLLSLHVDIFLAVHGSGGRSPNWY